MEVAVLLVGVAVAVAAVSVAVGVEVAAVGLAVGVSKTMLDGLAVAVAIVALAVGVALVDVAVGVAATREQSLLVGSMTLKKALVDVLVVALLLAWNALLVTGKLEE